MSSGSGAPLLEPLWTAAQARAADAYTIEDLGVPGIVLMEHAGRAVADIIRRRTPRPASALVFAGPGNNGGDGWVIARHLWGGGIPCPVVTLASPDALTGDASLAAQMFLTTAEARGWTNVSFGGPFFLVDLADDVDHLMRVALLGGDGDVVIDAIFGTGLRVDPGGRAVEGVAARVIAALSRAPVPVVAVDVPSGLPTDGAAPLGPCVSASSTVTFQGRKIAHASEPGRSRCGEVTVVDIGILQPDDTAPAAWRLVSARPCLPAVDVDGHKHTHGHVVVVAGASPGAARLVGRAALRSGCGLATLLVDAADAPSVTPSLEAELMSRPLEATALDVISRGAGDARRGALVIGPGLGQVRAVGTMTRALLERAGNQGVPAVVDAEAVDALGFLRAPANASAASRALKAVVTPHPGEAARVLGWSNADVQRDRIRAVRALSELFAGDVVVLKGSSPLVAQGGQLVVVEGGAPALAVAGSGDVLAGCIGGLLARGLPPWEAALVGVEAHQRAGASLASTGQTRGHLASDIADALARALAAP